jgi:hypothetical protein
LLLELQYIVFGGEKIERPQKWLDGRKVNLVDFGG